MSLGLVPLALQVRQRASQCSFRIIGGAGFHRQPSRVAPLLQRPETNSCVRLKVSRCMIAWTEVDEAVRQFVLGNCAGYQSPRDSKYAAEPSRSQPSSWAGSLSC